MTTKLNRADEGIGFDITVEELECLGLIARGQIPSEIGLAIGLSEEQDLVHLVSVQAKLNASNRLHALVLALRRKLI